MHTEAEDDSFAISPFTYDADLALDPNLLGGSPARVEAMSWAGFRLGEQPGLYSREGLSQVDLLVPEAVGGPCLRAGRLGPHGNWEAMMVRGLEGALVSHRVRNIGSLVPGAERSCLLKVGPRRCWCRRSTRSRNAWRMGMLAVRDNFPRAPSTSTGSSVLSTPPNWPQSSDFCKPTRSRAV